jgi:signal transduction histidine kinase
VSAPRRTFSGRVARALTVAVALSAALASTLTAAIAARAERAREDARLEGAAVTLQRELEASPTRRPADVADDEDAEVAPTNVRLALYEGPRRLGGDGALAPHPGRGCETTRRDGHPWRSCVIAHGRWDIVAASDVSSLRAVERVLAGASAVACAFAVLVAFAMSRRVSAVIVRPLARLSENVARVDAESPRAAQLGAGDGYAEIDSLRASLEDLLRRLDAALSQSRRFAADAAHELRTPLTTALGEIEWAMAAGTRTEQSASLDRARATLASLAETVERLLILASSLEGASLSREAVSVADVAGEVVAALDEVSRARVTVAVDEDAYVRGDASLVRVMLANAVHNALKFAPEGAVEVSAVCVGAEVLVRVRDHGPGVSPEDRERVFEAFHRTSRARAGVVPGYGIGLALVGHIARAHGGAAAFEDVSTGASLKIALPAFAG